jgi:hypothetical protein
LLTGVSHCVFALPGNQFCTFTCSGAVDAAKQLLVKRYMTAWFNYYLLYKTEDYTYLYGTQSDADVNAGLIERQVSTAPRNVGAQPLTNAIRLTWTRYNHPVVAGYNVYRRQTGEVYSATPNARVMTRSVFTDTALSGGQVYSYTLRSFDPAGNVHQASDEASAIPAGAILTNTPTPTHTPTPTATIVYREFVYLPIILKR